MTGPRLQEIVVRLEALLERLLAQTPDMHQFMREFYDIWTDRASDFPDPLRRPLEEIFWALEDWDDERPDPEIWRRMRESARRALDEIAREG